MKPLHRADHSKTDRGRRACTSVALTAGRPFVRKKWFYEVLSYHSLDSVREFAGQDYETAVVPKQARKLLSHFEERSQHHEIIDERSGEL